MIKRDIRRLVKSSYIWIGFGLVFLFSIMVPLLVSQGIRFGISIFGQMSLFKSPDGIFLQALDYRKGLGWIGAILISLFIGKEYQYRAWQHFISYDISRTNIYLGKMILSMLITIGLFMTYAMVNYIFFLYKGLEVMGIGNFLTFCFHGALIYAMLASILCFFSMIIKNNLIALLMNISFVLFEKSMVNVFTYLGKIFKVDDLVQSIIQTTLYGVFENIRLGDGGIDFKNLVVAIAFISILSMLGPCFFRRYKL